MGWLTRWLFIGLLVGYIKRLLENILGELRIYSGSQIVWGLILGNFWATWGLILSSLDTFWGVDRGAYWGKTNGQNRHIF